MLAKEHVKTRIEGDGLSFTEFSYMLLQSFDFLYLYQYKNCRLQIGGSDQWGNITAGLELIRRKIGGSAYALSFPLVTDAHGKKLGKTAEGTIWLDAEATSPYQFHQYWLNIEDKDVIALLKMFTFLNRVEIEEIERTSSLAPEKRAAQRRLADEVCTLVHGEDATEAAKKSAEVLFGGTFEGRFRGRGLEKIASLFYTLLILFENLLWLAHPKNHFRSFPQLVADISTLIEKTARSRKEKKSLSLISTTPNCESTFCLRIKSSPS
jgi:tyrosyl-tRNA synthetase